MGFWSERKLHRKCCFCSSEWEVGYNGWFSSARRHPDDYYSQKFFFFIPFYKWPICDDCYQQRVGATPGTRCLRSLLRLTFSFLSLVVFYFLGLLVAFMAILFVEDPLLGATIFALGFSLGPMALISFAST